MFKCDAKRSVLLLLRWMTWKRKMTQWTTMLKRTTSRRRRSHLLRCLETRHRRKGFLIHHRIHRKDNIHRLNTHPEDHVVSYGSVDVTVAIMDAQDDVTNDVSALIRSK